MSDDDDLEHRRALLTRLSEEPGGPLTIDAPHATIHDRRYFRTVAGTPVPTRIREDLHQRILAQWAAARPDVQRGRRAILMAGPPGAGKSTAQAELLGQDRPRWRLVDADDFKSRLLERAVADGALQQMLPPELRAPAGQPSLFQPHELSVLVHRESSLLLEQAAEHAITRGENVVIDGTLAWQPWAIALTAALGEQDYAIAVVDVEAPQQVAAERIVQRWRRGYREGLADPAGTGLGGRWLPPSAVDLLFQPVREPDGLSLHGTSVCEVNARELAEQHRAVRRYDRYWTVAADQDARHVERRERGPDGAMHPVPIHPEHDRGH